MEYAKAADAIPSTRQTILLTVTEQDYLIGEMHRNLEALSSIISALAQNDARNVARRSGWGCAAIKMEIGLRGERIVPLLFVVGKS
jgi:hypothetical protein